MILSPASRRWAAPDYPTISVPPSRRCCRTTIAGLTPSASKSPAACSFEHRERIKIMKQIIVITGASSGFGALAARALARAGHTVYASMRETTGRNAAQVAAVDTYAAEHGVDLRAIELDVASQASTDTAIAQIVAAHERLDVVVHNAGHMVLG